MTALDGGIGDADAPLVDIDRLATWLASAAPTGGDDASLTVDRLGTDTGTANALFLVRRGEEAWVLRRPPVVKLAPSASNMVREHRVLRALDGSAVPHPRSVALCEDETVLGVPFLLMELIVGFTPVDPLPPPFDSDGIARHELGLALVDGLAELAMFDWRAAGLEGFGRPDRFLERQVERWRGQLESYRSRELANLDSVTTWLRDNRPPMGAAALMHGDFSLYNVMVAHGAPVRLAAIIDWDMATIGDPLMDLGLLLARWNHGGEEAVGVVDIANRVGLASRDDLIQRYAARTDRDVSGIGYYEVLALFKLACIIEANYTRACERGGTEAASIADVVPSLLRAAAAISNGRR